MEVKTILSNFNYSIDRWIDELEHYDDHQLMFQPGPNSWSIGQVITHLLEETESFIQEIETGLNSNENASGEMSAEAKTMFENNSFPDLKLEGPADAPKPPQPAGKAELREGLKKLKAMLNQIGEELLRNSNHGKTKHPGHHYFSAGEWFQWAKMHFRHHFRQKERINKFLKSSVHDL
ncbi:hypothetical protein BH23BAC1_BH23BAC1_29570 [soil metagenome]